MKPIKFIEDNGTVLVFNPMYITDVKAVPAEDNIKWCLVISLTNSGSDNSVYTKIFPSKEECLVVVDEICSKMETA